jgi:hypothetical protein
MPSYPQQEAYRLQMRWDIEHNPHECLSNTPGGVHNSASQPSDPHSKASRIWSSRWDVVCLCIHGFVQDTKQYLFSNPCQWCLNHLHSFFFLSRWKRRRISVNTVCKTNVGTQLKQRSEVLRAVTHMFICYIGEQWYRSGWFWKSPLNFCQYLQLTSV